MCLVFNFQKTGSNPLSEKELLDLLKECTNEGILVDFLKMYGTEIINMLFTEMTEEEARDLAREHGFEEGYRSRGRQDGFTEGETIDEQQGKQAVARNLKASGMSPDEII